MRDTGTSDRVQALARPARRDWTLRRIQRILVTAARILAIAALALLRGDGRQHGPLLIEAGSPFPLFRPLEPLDGYAERLGQAIQVRTVAAETPEQTDPKPFLELRSFLERAFPLVHSHLEREIHGGHSLLYRWKGLDPVAGADPPDVPHRCCARRSRVGGELDPSSILRADRRWLRLGPRGTRREGRRSRTSRSGRTSVDGRFPADWVTFTWRLATTRKKVVGKETVDRRSLARAGHHIPIRS